MACQDPSMVTESQSLSPPLLHSTEKPVREVDVLYNRIDQQVELISVLKQRLDEMTKRWERSECEIEQQELERSKLKGAYSAVSEKYAKLEIRWCQLSENHKEIIALKDDYKERCKVLTDKLKRYKAGESAAIAEEHNRIEKLQKEITEMRAKEEKQLSYEINLHEKFKGLESRISELRDRESSLTTAMEEEKQLHSASVAQLELQLQQSKNTLTDNKSRNEQLLKQVDDLTKQMIGRGKLVQEKDCLLRRLREERDKAVERGDKLVGELAAFRDCVNSGRLVRELREDILEERERYRKLERESEQFKTAAKEQLHKERTVNAELRHVSSLSRHGARVATSIADDIYNNCNRE